MKKTKQRKNYTEEFKRSAVDLSNEIGVSSVAKKLSVSLSSLQRWKKQQQEEEQFEIALDMLKKDSEFSIISKVTGWSEERVKRLEKFYIEQRQKNKEYYLKMFKENSAMFSKVLLLSKEEFKDFIKQAEKL